MNTFIIILFLGISLSMDAFSLSIFLGTVLTKKKALFFILIVGLFHFIMPVIGSLIGYKISNLFVLNGDYIFGFILLFLSFQIFYNIYKENNTCYNLNYYELILLSFGVAIDSFGIGFGLSFTDNYSIYSLFVFSICSMFFSYTGILIGRYTNSILGIYSKIFGGFLLLVFGILQLV